jgi:hypothetical protein
MKQQDGMNTSGACFKSRTEDDQNIAKFGKEKLADPFPNGYDFHLEPLMPIKEILISLVHPVFSCYH